MYSDIMKILPSGARESPRYKTTLGCRASLNSEISSRTEEFPTSDLLHQPPLTLEVFGYIVFS